MTGCSPSLHHCVADSKSVRNNSAVFLAVAILIWKKIINSHILFSEPLQFFFSSPSKKEIKRQSVQHTRVCPENQRKEQITAESSGKNLTESTLVITSKFFGNTTAD